jgi:hypothetical protein
MHYRLELLEDDILVVRNVETDLVLGFVLRIWGPHPRDRNRLKLLGCTILNKDGRDELATISAATVPNALEQAPIAVAAYEQYYGYPGFKAEMERPQPRRIEYLLGTLLADTASTAAQGLIEYLSGGLTVETRDKCADLIVRLYAIWYASRFRSFDAERWDHEPYFANTPPSKPRMSFPAAAQHYGMMELRSRFPDQSEALLKEALSWPLEMLRCTLDGLIPADTDFQACVVAERRRGYARDKRDNDHNQLTP